MTTPPRHSAVARRRGRRPLPAPVLALAALALLVAGAAAAVFVHPLAGIALVAGAVAAPFVLADIDLAFVAVVAVITVLPFAAIPLGIGFNPTFLDLALGALYLIWIVRLATRTDRLLPLPPLGWAVLLFIGLMVATFVAGLGHGTPTKNQMRAFGELILGAGLFFVVGTLIVDRASLRRVFLALVGLACVAALIGLGLYLLPDGFEMRVLSLLHVVDYPTGPTVLRYLNDDPSRLQRATGTSVDPNSFGGMLAAVSALLVPQILTRAPLVARKWSAAMAGVMLLALLATVSRGSLAGFAAAMVVVGLLQDPRLLAAVATAGVAFLAGARATPWTARYVEHLTAGLAGKDLATRMRVGEYRDALRLIERYPTLGVGFGGVRDIDLYRGVSSLYLIIAETMGLLGLTAFLALMGAFAAWLYRLWRGMAPDGLRAVVLGTLAALTAALVSGTFDHYFFTYPHAFALLWLMLGLGVAAPRVASAEARRGPTG